MNEFKVGDSVQGRKNEFINQLGVISEVIKNGSRCRYNVRFNDSEQKGLQESDFWKVNPKPAEIGSSDSSSDSSSDASSSSSSALTASSPAKRSAGSSAHVLQALRYTPYYIKELEKKAAYSRPAEARRRCSVCGVSASAFCYDCSVRPESEVDPEFCAICSSMGKSRGKCYRKNMDIVAAADEMRL